MLDFDDDDVSEDLIEQRGGQIKNRVKDRVRNVTHCVTLNFKV